MTRLGGIESGQGNKKEMSLEELREVVRKGVERIVECDRSKSELSELVGKGVPVITYCMGPSVLRLGGHKITMDSDNFVITRHISNRETGEENSSWENIGWFRTLEEAEEFYREYQSQKLGIKEKDVDVILFDTSARCSDCAKIQDELLDSMRNK